MTTVDWVKLAQDTEHACEHRGVTLSSVAALIGATPSALTRLRQGGRISADRVVALAAWLYPEEPLPSWVSPQQRPSVDMEAT